METVYLPDPESDVLATALAEELVQEHARARTRGRKEEEEQGRNITPEANGSEQLKGGAPDLKTENEMPQEDAEPEVHVWAPTPKCTCPQCEKARSPTAEENFIAGFCVDFIGQLERTALPDKEGLEACKALWQSDLEELVAKRGEQSLSSVSYALRLAHLIFSCGSFVWKEEGLQLYTRFLAPRLFDVDEKRRNELLGAASRKSLAGHLNNYAWNFFNLRKDAFVKRICLASLDVLTGDSDCNGISNDRDVASLFWALASALLRMGELKSAWDNLQKAAKCDEPPCRCCILRECLADIGNMHRDKYAKSNSNKSELEQILYMSVSFARRACQRCVRLNVLGNAFYELGYFLLSAGLSIVKAESYLKQAESQTMERIDDARSKGAGFSELEDEAGYREELVSIIQQLGMVCIKAHRFDEAASHFRRALELEEEVRGLLHTRTEGSLGTLYAFAIDALSSKHAQKAVVGSQLAPFISQKLLAFITQAGRAPAGVDTGGVSLNAYVQNLQRGEIRPIGTRLLSKLEERQRALEDRKREGAERERLRQEAERAERAARNFEDKEKARELLQQSNWAGARKLLNGLLKRSPEDAEARLLRIQCVAGAGQLEAAAREAEAWERELAASEESSSATADLLVRVQQERQNVERRQEVSRREKAEAEARARAQAAAEQEARQQAEQQQQQRREQERLEARRRREEEAAAAALAAARQAEVEEQRKEGVERRDAERRHRELEGGAGCALVADAQLDAALEALRIGAGRPRAPPPDPPFAAGRLPPRRLEQQEQEEKEELEEEPECACAICIDAELDAVGPDAQARATVLLPCGRAQPSPLPSSFKL
eukprot:tig00000254_g22510.t1